MSMKSLFNTVKQKDGLVKQLDQFLLKHDTHVEDGDRKSVTNSPSSALGCSRANYYQREGIQKDVIEPRVRRIFDNGHGVHARLQGYLTAMGFLLMDEVPLFNAEYEIQGHTDGIGTLSKNPKVCEILEIKSINTNQFSKLREPKEEHRAQAQVYIFTAEEHRKMLKIKYPTRKDFVRSRFKRWKRYEKLYQHLTDGSNFTRAEKIKYKVNQHMKMDKILYDLIKPITKAIVLYEDKNTQELKEFLIEMDEGLMHEVLEKYQINNEYWKMQQVPPRECKAKTEGRWCPYVHHCFE